MKKSLLALYKTELTQDDKTKTSYCNWHQKEVKLKDKANRKKKMKRHYSPMQNRTTQM